LPRDSSKGHNFLIRDIMTLFGLLPDNTFNEPFDADLFG
jgi:hypothetical protein